jgi:hypothetical protein
MLNRTFRASVAVLGLAAFATASLASTISGTVTDRTTGKPSKGDTIAVINTAQGMDEIAKVTSDAQGKFQVNAPDGGQILLHITHNGAEYFKSVPPGNASVDIDVYDSAPKIDGISGEALVLRAETDGTGKALNVTENFFIQNASVPPKTQYGGNTFDFYLPTGAQIAETVASAPSGLPTNVQVKTVDAGSGHYAFTFPIRPGETRFQVAYTLPYSGKQDFSLKLTVPTGDVAVMLPKSMQFLGQGQTQFQPINPGMNAQSYDAHTPPFAQPIQFSLSGSGQLPRAQERAQSGGAQGAQGGQTSSERPGGGLAAPGDPDAENDPWSKYKWWIVGVLGLALAGGAGVMLKRSAVPAGADSVPLPSTDAVDPLAPLPADVAGLPSATNAVRETTSTLQALKEELFELEADRIAGRINAAEYAEHKAAFDVVLRRALSRIGVGSNASNV